MKTAAGPSGSARRAGAGLGTGDAEAPGFALPDPATLLGPATVLDPATARATAVVAAGERVIAAAPSLPRPVAYTSTPLMTAQATTISPNRGKVIRPPPLIRSA
jgi:hypothetical protein